MKAMKSHAIGAAGAVMAALAIAAPAAAQQSFYNPSAAQPSPGVLLFRQTFEYTQFGRDPSPLMRDIEQFKINTELAYGITSELAMIAMLPVIGRSMDSAAPGVSSDDFNIGDAHIMFKYRVWQHDSGPIDTMRLSLLGGLDVPTGQAPFDNLGWDPMIGAVFTSIQGRHGFNLAGRFKFNTHSRGAPGMATTLDDGLEDQFMLDASYLYRLAPAAYQAETHGAWYAMLDCNAMFETNGDAEVRLASGIMYEARNWVVEASVQVPIYEDLNHRPETDFTVGLGFRILF
jgi:hypothetical protein